MNSTFGAGEHLDVSTAPRAHTRKHMRYSTHEWDSHRPMIERLYLDEGKRLCDIMALLDSQGFRPSIRSFKDKIGEWGLRKHIPAQDMALALAKAGKRKAVEEKDSIILIDGRPLGQERVHRFQKRKSTMGIPASPSAPTPPYIALSTPELKTRTLSTESTSSETTAFTAGTEIVLFSDSTAVFPDSHLFEEQELLPSRDTLCTDFNPTGGPNQYATRQQISTHTGSTAANPRSPILWHSSMEPLNSVPLHKWGLQDGFIEIFEAGDDFPGFDNFRVSLLLSATSREVAFGFIDDQIQEIRQLVFCLERVLLGRLKDRDGTTSYLNPSIVTREFRLIDRIMDHIIISLEHPLFPIDPDGDFAKLWLALGVSPSDTNHSNRVITKIRTWNSSFTASFAGLDRYELTWLPKSTSALKFREANLISKIIDHFVYRLHSFLLEIGGAWAALLLSSDGLALYEDLLAKSRRADMSWFADFGLYVRKETEVWMQLITLLQRDIQRLKKKGQFYKNRQREDCSA